MATIFLRMATLFHGMATFFDGMATLFHGMATRNGKRVVILHISFHTLGKRVTLFCRMATLLH
jgi:hypothetical protein